MGLIRIILNNKKATIKIIIVFSIIIIILFFKNGILDRIELSNKKANAVDLFYDKIKTNDSLKSYYFKILFDSDEIERIARHKYGMIKEGEELYIFEEEK